MTTPFLYPFFVFCTRHNSIGLVIDTIDYVTRIGNSSCAPIIRVIVDFAMAHPRCDFFAEFCAGFQLFPPKEYIEER